MRFRHIQCLEAIMVCFNLWTVNDVKAHAKEHFLYLFKSSVQRVRSAYSCFLARKRNVYGFLCKPYLLHFALKLFLTLIESVLDISSYLVCKLTDNRSFLCGKLAHLLKYGSYLSRFAKKSYSEIFQQLGVINM